MVVWAASTAAHSITSCGFKTALDAVKFSHTLRCFPRSSRKYLEKEREEKGPKLQEQRQDCWASWDSEGPAWERRAAERLSLSLM